MLFRIVSICNVIVKIYLIVFSGSRACMSISIMNVGWCIFYFL